VFEAQGRMSVEHTLTVLLRRDPTRDRQENRIAFEGYEMLWPDGRPISVGFDAFCRQGQRLLGLGRYLAGSPERLVDLVRIPLVDPKEPFNRLPGHRVRRLCLRRTGRQGRLHFVDGTPTTIVLDLDRDEPQLLQWFGLPDLGDGESGWFDLAARSVEPARLEMAGDLVH